MPDTDTSAPPIYPEFWGRYPIAWVGFAVLLLAIPVLALALQDRARFVAILPSINACLNGSSALLLYAGYRAIRARRVALHWKLMVSATGTSTLFLTFYLIRFALTGVHKYPLDDWTHTAYLAILGSHTLLAVTVPFLAGRTLWLGYTKQFAKHRRIARWTFPIWMYVSVTGVIVYLMLYQWAGVG